MVAPLNYDGSGRKNLNYDSWNRRRGRQSRS
jgi:hypothetical protein